MPMTANAAEWNHRAPGAHHEVVVRHDKDFHRDEHRPFVRNEPYRPPFVSEAPIYRTPFASGYGNDACANYQRLRNVYRRDLRTGHPAAANDVLQQMQAVRHRCL
jgi:hypothetical protein